MEKNATVILPGATLCNNSSCVKETGYACDAKTGGEVVKSKGNVSEGKGVEGVSQIDVSEQELIGGYQHNMTDNSALIGENSSEPLSLVVKLDLQTHDNSVMTEENSSQPVSQVGILELQTQDMTGGNTAKPSSDKVFKPSILGLQTPSPKSILMKQRMSVSPRSKKIVRFALIAMDNRDGETRISSLDQNELRNVNASICDKFDQVSMSQANIVVTREKDGNTSNFSDHGKSMSVTNCNLEENEVTESQSVCKSVSDELKSLVDIVREKSDNCIDSFCSVGFPKTNDNENKDSNNQNTSDSLSPPESKSDSNGGRKFAFLSKTFLSKPSPPKSSIFIRRGFPRIVLRDKSNKPQRARNSMLIRGEECPSKYVETSHISDPENTDSAIVKRGRHICSGKSFMELKKDSKHSPAALPSVENNKLSRILEVSLEKIDENVLVKYGLNIKDHDLSKLIKCPDITPLQNVNDDLKENADIEKQKGKRRRSAQIIEQTSVGKKVGVNNKVLDTVEGLGKDFSCPEEECLKNLSIQTSEGFEKKEDSPNEQLRNTDTSLSFPVNEENNNVTSVPCRRSLSTSNMNKELDRKYVQIHIAPLDPVLLSKYGIILEHSKPANSYAELTGHNMVSKIIDGELTNCDRKTSMRNENSTINGPRNNLRGSRRSFLSNHLVPKEVVTLYKADQDSLETGVQGGISDISNSNLKKSRRNIGANSNDLKVKNAVGNKKAVLDNAGSFGDGKAISRKITCRNVKSSIDVLVDGHEPTGDNPLDPIHLSKCRVNLENKAHDNAVLTSHIIENKVSDGEVSGCNSKGSIIKEDSIAHDATNNVRRSRRSFLSNDSVAKKVVTTDKSDGDTIETGIQEKRISNISDSNLKKSRRSIGANSNDLKIFNAVVSIKALQLRGFGIENKIIGELKDSDTKRSINNENSTPNDDASDSVNRIVLNDPVAKEVVSADKSDGDTIGIGFQEGRISDISGPNIKKSRKIKDANLNDWKIRNSVGSNNTSHSGDVERVSRRISQGKLKRMSDGLVFEPKSTPKPDASDKVNHSEVERSLSIENTILLNNTVHNTKVAIVRLSRIDCDLPRYGIDKGQLLGSSYEKVRLVKEVNNHNDQGSILTQPNEDHTDSISTPKISLLDSPFTSEKRKRCSSDTADVISTSSERPSKWFKMCKTQ